MERNYDTSTNQTSTANEGMMPHHEGRAKPFRESTPEEVRERVKEAVAKGVAAVAGALKGFTEQTRKEQLPQETREAISKAGETTREAVKSTSTEVEKMKQPLQEASKTVKETGKSLGKTTRDVAQTAKEEFQRTKEVVKPSKSQGSQGSSSSAGTPPSTPIVEETFSTTTTKHPVTEYSPGTLGTEAGERSNVRGTSLQENAMQRGRAPPREEP